MLRDQILNAVNNPIKSDDGFDIHKALWALVKDIGLNPEDTGGEIKFYGKDPVMPSPIRFASATAIGLAAKAVAIAKLWKLRTGEGQDIDIDIRRTPHRLSPFFQGRWEKINGFPPGYPMEQHNPFAANFYKTLDDRHVIPLCYYRRLGISAFKLLNTPPDHDSVAAEIGKWTADDLEETFNKAGLPLTKMRSVYEFLELEQFEFLQRMPVFEIEKIGDSDPIPFTTNPKTPLDGVKALGMGHVIAGAATGRGLALHGADVLNVWSIKDEEWESLYATANVGMRSTKLDLSSPEGKAKMEELVGGADIFFANRRNGYLAKYGLSAEEMAAVRPGIIHVTVSLYGLEGPWKDHFGFDLSAGAATGINVLEGSMDEPGYPTIKVINDFIVGWLMTTAAITCLIRRSQEGGSYKVHLSLTRVMLWMYTLGIFDKKYAAKLAGSSDEHIFADPELFTAETPLGTYQGVTDQVYMSKTPGHYKYAILPRGASKPVWES
ncbi:MAG TPA: CoA transferase [Chitinophagaceae bacterium]|jgi:crotonobetainyl-CoA:carnitine CoA-transferase CaiB-like acyl-CoA transferase